MWQMNTRLKTAPDAVELGHLFNIAAGLPAPEALKLKWLAVATKRAEEIKQGVKRAAPPTDYYLARPRGSSEWQIFPFNRGAKVRPRAGHEWKGPFASMTAAAAVIQEATA